MRKEQRRRGERGEGMKGRKAKGRGEGALRWYVKVSQRNGRESGGGGGGGEGDRLKKREMKRDG